MRTRPVFEEWQLELEIELDLTVLDPAKIDQLIEEAGRYQGLGDYRPLYGRFLGKAVIVHPAAKAKEKVAVGGEQ